MDNRKAVSFRNVDITDGFWAQRQQMNKDVTIFAGKQLAETALLLGFRYCQMDGKRRLYPAKKRCPVAL